MPGFQIGNAPGHPTEWSKFDKALFRYAVETTVAKAPPGLKTTKAIQRVAALPYWKEKTAGMNPAALRAHYDKAPKELVQLMLEGPPEPFDWLFSVN